MNIRMFLVMISIVVLNLPVFGAPRAVWDQLIKAINEGNVAVVKHIVPRQIQPQEQTLGGRTPLKIAQHVQQVHKKLYKNSQPTRARRLHEVVVYLTNIAKKRVQKASVVPVSRSIVRPQRRVAAPHPRVSGGKISVARQSVRPYSAPSVIYFYDEKTPAYPWTDTRYYPLTNFYIARDSVGRIIPIVVDRVSWPSSEHYFQAQKYDDPQVRNQIRAMKTARDVFEAAKRGGRYQLQGYQIARDWDIRRLAVMDKVLYAKFSQNPHLKALLLGTGNAQLVEASPVDSFWGTGAMSQDPKTKAIRWQGQNNLGKALMRLRERLNKEAGMPGAHSIVASKRGIGKVQSGQSVKRVIKRSRR